MNPINLLIKNSSIRTKLLLISLLPLLALLYFIGQDVLQKQQARKAILVSSEQLEQAERISELVHEFQQEREYSITYFLSKGNEGRSELFAQRDVTDRAVSALKKTLLKYGKTSEDIRSIEAVNDLRLLVTKLTSNSDSVRIGFGKLNEQLIEAVSRTSLNSQTTSIKNLLGSQISLMYAREQLGQIRAIGLQAMLGQGFDIYLFGEFSALSGKYQTNIAQFRNNISGDMAKHFEQQSTNPALLQSAAMIDSISRNPGITRLPFTRSEWWISMTNSLNVLKEVQDYSTLSIRKMADDDLRQINASIYRNLVLASLIVVLMGLLLYFTIHSILTSLNQLQIAAQRMAEGDVDVTLTVDGKDEIGEVATSFGGMIGVIKEYAKAADAIGKGTYDSVLQVRGSDDVLGIALKRMQDSLILLAKENADRTWLLNGASQLNDRMRGEKTELELSQEIINFLTDYLKAQIGTVYLYENEKLKLSGTYAFHHRKKNDNEIAIGQGLVGQAALEKKPIIFENVPNDYVKINSALGSVAPRNIIVYPFFYEMELKGVFEIGFAKDVLDELPMQLLNLVSENVGIVFHATQARTRMKELLEVTQQQAEELEVQQEELRQSNEELQSKTNMLLESESELKAQQEELQQLNEELEEKANLLEEQKERLEMANVEVQMKARELEVTSKYKSEFLANMSHELRTPLNSILILSQLMTENRSKNLSEKEIQFAQNINSSGNDLLNLINEILDLSKVEAGKIELELVHVAIDDLTNSIRSTFTELARNKTIDFDIIYQKEKTNNLETDVQRLEQILRNLLSNAFKFTSKGGKVTLDIDTGAPAKALRNPKLRRLNKVITFSVKDTGIGIPEDKLGIIFEAFQQADGTTRRKYGGTGLGLSISRELANALGGEITLESEEGKGSTFTLHLPLDFDADIALPGEKKVDVKKASEHKPEPVHALAESVHVALKADNQHVTPEIEDDRHSLIENDKVVLIIEDDPLFAQLLLDFVRERNYKGIIAQQGNTGLSLARQFKPDAILLDMTLPVVDGTEVLRQLKNEPELRHIPVQIISGYDRRKEGMELGAFDFIMKPLSKNDFQDIFDRLEEFMSKKMKKLLIVEDNKEQSQAIQELVGEEDVKLYTAFSGKQALELLHEDNFDCAIVDLGLPDMSGFELLEKIKSDNAIKRVPIIIYTARDLTKEEAAKLNRLASTVVLKTASSRERLLDETTLFLHRVESRLPEEKQQILRKLHRADEILKNKKVLVVDDDIRNIYSLTNVLEDEGMRYVTAENGKIALKTLQEHPDIDIVLMDVMMPEMDGYEATQEIRKMSAFQKLPIVALTAKAMKGDREKCLEVGMSDYIAKPVNVEQLLSLMRVWLYR